MLQFVYVCYIMLADRKQDIGETIMYDLEDRRFGHLTAIKCFPGGKWLSKCEIGE